MERYIILEKTVGETPLSCAEAYRSTRTDLAGVPLAYAGRLDPMASGKLLVLVGEECKNQTAYHNLDKEYEFSVLFGIESDTQDVLGRIKASKSGYINRAHLQEVATSLIGPLTFPYPLFSARTVRGKPLHMWTLEGRLDEIEIPTRTSLIYELEVTAIETLSRQEVVSIALQKIDTIPKVTDPRKALGNDFRRDDVRTDWNILLNNNDLPTHYTITHFRCVTSSGAYMRKLATIIAERLQTIGLAWSIHRSKIGTYNNATYTWSKLF